MTDQPILQIDKLDFSIGGHAILKNISCHFAAGGIHGLIGPNGSGKSTLAAQHLPHLGTPKRARF